MPTLPMVQEASGSAEGQGLAQGQGLGPGLATGERLGWEWGQEIGSGSFPPSGRGGEDPGESKDNLTS